MPDKGNTYYWCHQLDRLDFKLAGKLTVAPETVLFVVDVPSGWVMTIEQASPGSVFRSLEQCQNSKVFMAVSYHKLV